MDNFVAIFDSGIGGLTVYSKIKELLPNENIVYLADTANCPYGIKTIEEINKITNNNINYLKKLGAKVVVIACNTATSSVLNEIRESNGYIQGVIEPTAKLALETTTNNKIGLFATNLTVSSGVYQKYLDSVEVLAEGCSDFVPVIEEGDFSSNNMKKMIKNHLVKVEGADTLILGCTHFPYIKQSISELAPNLKLVESGFPLASEVINYLKKNNITTSNQKSKHVFLTTSSIEKARKQLKILNVSFDEVKEVNVE